MTETILDRWHLTAAELTQIVDLNPSLRGFMIGYVAEFQVRKLLLNDDRISNIHKYDDHDRSRGKKNDLCVTYRGYEFTIEVKSLQTESVRFNNDAYIGTFQCDASDKRPISLPNGEMITTTCLEVGSFDIVAVNLFAFRHQWQFGFALNRDLPRSKHKKYSAEQQQFLLATSMQISLPLKPPFVSNPIVLLDQLVKEKAEGKSEVPHLESTLLEGDNLTQRDLFDPK